MAYDAYSAPAPVEHPAVTKQRLRSNLCRLIDRLVTALDEIDGDPDLEPSLAHPELAAGLSQHLQERTLPLWHPHETDLEEECEGEGAQCEDEGAEHDGREPEEGA